MPQTKSGVKLVAGHQQSKEEKIMTASELKSKVEQGTDSFFFTHDTMRFFGDTMANYGVRDGGTMPYHWDETGNNYSDIPRMVEVWELYRKHPVKHGLKSSAYFDKKSFRKIIKDVLNG
jgi:hypothetical protein